TRSSMPAPPPKGTSSTWPPASGVCARMSTHSTEDPPASALRTWRCERNHSNHCGKRVKMSICTVSAASRVRIRIRCAAGIGARAGAGEAEELAVDLDRAARCVDAQHRVFDHRHDQRGAARDELDLQGLARRQLEHSSHGADRAPAVRYLARLEFPRPPFARSECPRLLP